MGAVKDAAVADRLRKFWARVLSLETSIYGLAERFTPAALTDGTHYVKTILESVSIEHATIAVKYVVAPGCEVERRAAKADLEPCFFEEMANLSEYFAAGYLELCRIAQHAAPAMYKGQEGSSHCMARAMWCYGRAMELSLAVQMQKIASTADDPGRSHRCTEAMIGEFCDHAGKRPEGGIAILQMELVQAILVAPKVPSARDPWSLGALSALETSNRLAPKCECGGSMIVQGTRGRRQYRKCDKCGATGKTTKGS